jgi:metal-responsive CopG/Arc/MetJ family transcriptional regulator
LGRIDGRINSRKRGKKMSIKISISLDDELVKLIKKEAEKTGRSVSELIADAIKAYRKLKRVQAYARFAKSKAAEELSALEKAQFEVAKSLG